MNQVHAENSGLHVGKVKVDVIYHLDPNFILFCCRRYCPPVGYYHHQHNISYLKAFLHAWALNRLILRLLIKSRGKDD